MMRWLIIHRYTFYLTIFAAISIFDSFTHLGSWVLELSTGLVNEGEGFPDDYTGAMFFAFLFLLTLYSFFQSKNGLFSKTREVVFGLLAILGVLYIIAIIFMVIAWSGYTG